MDNCEIKVKGDQLTITIDLSKPGELSSTGKTKLIASTRGAAKIDHPKLKGLTVAVNVMVPVGRSS